MATATIPHSQAQPQLLPKRDPIVPIKVGIFGGQGSGKTTSAALLSLALSKQFHGGAPVLVTDTEPGWQFMRPLFEAEKVELIQRTQPTFKAMCDNLREAEKLGACVWAVDSLTIVWQELLKAARGSKSYIPIDQWGSIKSTWLEYTTLFLNSRMHCLALGRLQNDMDEIADEDHNGKTKLVKVGTKFKAGGGESFGYEPHLLIELSLERKAKTKGGVKLDGEGRMIHRADILKDRTWALNGKVFRWQDKAEYREGGYMAVWESLRAHFSAVQRTMSLVKIQSGSSEALFDGNGDSEYFREQNRRAATSAEIKGCMDLFFGGRGAEEVKVRLAVTDLIFGVKSKEAADQLPITQLERGLRILHAYEKRVDRNMDGAAAILGQITENIKEYDAGQSEEWDMPF
jgi:hypothetical protein